MFNLNFQLCLKELRSFIFDQRSVNEDSLFSTYFRNKTYTMLHFSDVPECLFADLGPDLYYGYYDPWYEIYFHGESVFITCYYGYEAPPDSSRTCENGVWNGTWTDCLGKDVVIMTLHFTS